MVPSSLRESLPQLPAEQRRRAFVPVALMGMMLTGAVWPAVEGWTSIILKVVLFATVSSCMTARLPRVNAAGGLLMLNVEELVVDNGA